MNKGICFFITPIGNLDSPERKQTDSIRNNILMYACEPFDLELVRADQIKGDNDINQDVVNCVRTAEVCVVDLTGLNPNVMFEFGLRHQTGLPVVILAKNGTKLPFDVISKRTIFFDDIDNANSCNNLVREIREYFSKFEADSYRKISPEPTLTDIYTRLDAIDKKISAPVSFDASNSIYTQGGEDIDQLLSNLDPSEAFHFAYKTNQLKLAEQILDLLKEQPYEYYLNKVCALANKGSVKAMQELERELPEIIKAQQFSTVLEAIGSLVSCYMRRDLEKDKLQFMDVFFTQAYSSATTNRDRAAILNQKQRMYAGAQQFEMAKELAEQMIALDDERPAYYFNYATILKNLGDIDGAKQQVKRSLEINTGDKPSEECLMLACTLFKGSTMNDDIRFYEDCLSKLGEINPYKARLTRFT